MSVATQREMASRVGPRERAELALAQLDQLPTLSPVVTRLLALTSDDEACVRDLIRVIESDPSLTACILRLVRRADLGVRSAGMTVARAVPLLGFRLVRSAALACPFFEALSAEGGGEAAAERRRGLWQHSLAVAAAAELLAEQGPPKGLTSNVFVAGLLHDVGKIALDVCFPKSFARAWEHAERDLICMCDAETAVLGFDHTIAGKRLATRWRLEPAIIDAIWLHHHSPTSLPSSVADPRVVQIVHLADGLVRRAGVGVSGSRHIVDIEEAAGSLGVDRRALDKVAEALPKRLQALFDSLGLEAGRDDDGAWVESLQRAHRELASSNAKLAETNHELKGRCAVLEAIAGLNRRVSDSDRVADVCVHAAEVLVGLFGAEGGVVLVADETSGLGHAGCAGTHSQASVLDLMDVPPIEAPAVFGRASREQVDLWPRCTGGPAPTAVWSASIAMEALRGIVLLDMEEAALTRVRPRAEDWSALQQAVGHAILAAWARGEAARTAEELIDLNRRLHAAQRELTRRRSLSMVAQMAGGAAHELNNPLAVISGRAQMELAECADADRRRSLDIIVEQAQRASDIVTELMRFAKPEEPQPADLPLGETVRTVCQHWASRCGIELGQLSVTVPDGATFAYCDPNHLREILGAVLTNAGEATDASRRRIEINSVPASSDETVRIRITDNGVGMSSEVLEHAFDPFYSSRPAGRGRGLGLSRAYRLAEINGGRLWIESKPNAGATVTIELPARAASAERHP